MPANLHRSRSVSDCKVFCGAQVAHRGHRRAVSTVYVSFPERYASRMTATPSAKERTSWGKKALNLRNRSIRRKQICHVGKTKDVTSTTSSTCIPEAWMRSTYSSAVQRCGQTKCCATPRTCEWAMEPVHATSSKRPSLRKLLRTRRKYSSLLTKCSDDSIVQAKSYRLAG